MTDERDPKVSAAYRELGAEEPPRALDEAILATAQGEAGGRKRWYAPLATAAVLVLAVAVTLNMQRERPDVESSVPQAPLPATVKEVAKEAAKPVVAQPEKIARRQTAEPPAPPESVAPAVPAGSDPKPFVADQPAASARADDSRGAASGATGMLARKSEELSSRDAQAAARAPQAVTIEAQAKRSAGLASLAESPERELERIADMRRQERHEEADKALAEFRKRFPDFKISQPMLERVERRSTRSRIASAIR